MGTLVAEVAALGLAVALTSPVSVVTVIVLLSMPSGRRRAIAFVSRLADRNRGDRRDRDLRPPRPGLQLQALHSLAGRVRARDRARFAALALGGSRLPPATAGEWRCIEPKWLSRVEGTHWLLAVAVGALMLSYGLSLAAASEILKANVSTSRCRRRDRRLLLTSIVTVAAPIVVAVAAPERSAQRLAAWKAWLLGNSRTVVLVVLMVVAALLIVRGISDLV